MDANDCAEESNSLLFEIEHLKVLRLSAFGRARSLQLGSALRSNGLIASTFASMSATT